MFILTGRYIEYGKEGSLDKRRMEIQMEKTKMMRLDLRISHHRSMIPLQNRHNTNIFRRPKK